MSIETARKTPADEAIPGQITENAFEKANDFLKGGR